MSSSQQRPVKRDTLIYNNTKTSERGLSPLAIEITKRKQAETTLEAYIRFERLLRDLSTTFANLTTSNANAVIAEGLQHVIDFAALDRCALIEFSDDQTELRITSAERTTSIQTPSQAQIPIGNVPWLAQQIQRGEIIIADDLLNDLPSEAVQERTVCEQAGLQSVVVIPLTRCGAVVGALVASSLHQKHTWPKELMPRLHIVGEIFANALTHKRMLPQLRTPAHQLETLVTEKVREREVARVKVIQTAKLASLGEMANGVAHELNQPLTAMLFEAEYLKAMAQQAIDAGESACFLSAKELYHIGDNLAQDIERSRRITNYLRAFSDIVKGDVVQTNVNRVIEGSFTLTEARLSQHNIIVERQLHPNPPPIQVNPHKLEQVFTNLISNAEYALEEMERRVAAGEVSHNNYRKTLTISTYVENAHVIAQVCDNGCGIPKTAQPHIFEPFFTTKPVGKGSGLGLSICHGFVTEFGGQIDFESEENQGSTFTLRFPLATPILAVKNVGHTEE